MSDKHVVWIVGAIVAVGILIAVVIASRPEPEPAPSWPGIEWNVPAQPSQPALPSYEPQTPYNNSLQCRLAGGEWDLIHQVCRGL